MSEVYFQPLYDRVLVKRLEISNKTASGIILSTRDTVSQDQGIVIAVGKGAHHSSGATIPPCVEVGNHVMFDRGGGAEIIIDGEKLLVVADKDIIGVIT